MGSLMPPHAEGKPVGARRIAVRLAGAVLLGSLAASGIPSAAAAGTPRPPAPGGPYISGIPDLYRMAARSEISVLGEVSALTRYAELRVVEAFAGGYAEPALKIQFRGQSWERRLDGASRIEFRTGERYLLFLRRYREHGKVTDPTVFELADGDWGCHLLTGEEEPVYVEAMRLLMGALSRTEPRERWIAMGGLLGSRNHLAAAAAMQQVAEAGVAGEGAIPVVLEQMGRGIAPLKEAGLALLDRLGPTLPRSFDRGSLAEAIHRRIEWSGGDPIPVRKTAVHCLVGLGPSAVPWLDRIAKEDASQEVRYEAAVAVLAATPRR